MKFKIGMFGFGCVAQGFYTGLNQNPQLEAEIVRICVKNGTKKRDAPAHLFTTKAAEIYDDKEIDIIVELIDDADAAIQIIRKGLAGGRAVISANKKALAENLKDVISWVELYQSILGYEGAVAGSIPILQNLDQFFSSQKITKIRGILNGTTNFILSQMREKGVDFETALKEAQHLGFAESDPHLDIGGLDAVYKIILLAYHAFGEILTVNQVDFEGIGQFSEEEFSDINHPDRKLKYIGSIEQTVKGLNAVLKKQWVSKSDPLFGVDDEWNAVTVAGNLSGEQTYIGRGAGSLPTGSAVLYDLKRVIEQLTFSRNIHRLKVTA